MAKPRTYFQVRNWDEFQHYKTRSPPWIKNYTDLLFDLEYAELSDAARGHLHGIWLLASKLNNRLPFDPKWIKDKLGCQLEPNLGELQRLDFIEPHCKQLMLAGSASTRREEKRREEGSSISPDRDLDLTSESREILDVDAQNRASTGVPRCPHQQLIRIFHEKCPSLPRVLKAELTTTEVKARWTEVVLGKDRDNGVTGPREPAKALMFFGHLFERVEESDWMSGRAPSTTNPNWKASYAWIMKRKSFYKILGDEYSG